MAEPLRLDLTVIAIPGFIAAMGLEYLWQRRHPAATGVAAAGDEVPGREGGEGAQDREADSPVPERQSRMPPEQARPQWLVQRVRSEHRQPREARIGDQDARVGQRRSEAAVVAPDIER